MKRLLTAALCLLTGGAATSASAQTVEEFLEGAQHHPSVDAVRAEADVARGNVRASRFALLPSVEMAGSYTRNQIPQEFVLPSFMGEPERQITIVAEDQFDAAFSSGD